MRTRALLACAVAGLSAGVITAAADGDTGQAELRPAAGDVVWNDVAPGQAAVKTVTVVNRGTAAGKVVRVKLGGPDFRVVADRCTNADLVPAATCGIDVEFRPSTSGTRVAHMRIDDTSACPEWVTLAGGGATANVNRVTARAASCQEVTQTVTNTTTVPGPTVTTTTTTPGTTTTTNNSSRSSTTGSSSSSRSKCVSRRKLTVNVKKAAGVTNVKATLAGKAMKVTKTAKGWRITVDMSNLKNGRYALRITRERSGKKALTTVKRYSTCVTPRS